MLTLTLLSFAGFLEKQNIFDPNMLVLTTEHPLHLSEPLSLSTLHQLMVCYEEKHRLLLQEMNLRIKLNVYTPESFNQKLAVFVLSN